MMDSGHPLPSMQNGIWEIYVVVGPSEGGSLRPCRRSSPGLTLIENPDYLTPATTSPPLSVAREHLEDAVILDGDQLIREAGDP